MMRSPNTLDLTGLSAGEVVEAYLAAFAEGRVNDILSLLDENVVWHIDGDPGVSTVGFLQGPDQVRRWLQNFPRNFRVRNFLSVKLLHTMTAFWCWAAFVTLY